MIHDGDGHFGVVLLNAEGDHIDLLANEIGEFDGSKTDGCYNIEVDYENLIAVLESFWAPPPDNRRSQIGKS